MLVGYARVSTTDQNLDMQIKALTEAGCNKLYSEKVSGAKDERMEFKNMLEFIRDGQDTVVVYKLDRLGRSMKQLIDTIQQLNQRNIGFKSLQENIDTTTAGGKLIFHIFASLAEFEREIIRERTNSGLQAARARGRLGGRPKKLNDTDAKIIKQLYNNPDIKTKEICSRFNISKRTLYGSVANKKKKWIG